ncbi:MAG TPA: succinate dehydrogenase, cytochrome b556 subunit [Spongiibacteraceae bacterium]|nr:succinate dehydrogenase, cytochrome b556 subunit [Spongiibacteraceae bacterium]HUH37277.1 succinate dehydrogenase, cytochrome b556 subunit [Spongiibacteraceae bacterium]
MKDKRPVNLDIGTIALPITAYQSILHRASGVFLAVGVAVLLWLLDGSLASEESFARTREIASGFWFKLVTWAVLAALIYHTLAGIKHLLMDMGIGESMAGGIAGSRAVFIFSAILIVLVGAWLW